jgi:hypothetical protein
MQKAYSLQQFEIAQAQALEEERRNLLARFGAVTLEMESVRAQIPALEQRLRTLVQAAAQRVGTRNFINARIEGPNLICEMPDEPAPSDGFAVMDSSLSAGVASDVARINGEAIATKR